MPRSFLPLTATLVLTGTLAGSAQTKSPAPTTTHHTASTAAHHTAAHPAAKSTCVVVPTLSAKIPVTPTGSGCPKALFTIAERLDYISPLVGPTVREGFSNLPMIFTLAYIDTEVGVGEVSKPHMYYTVQYTGYLPDGTKFDSSFDHPNKEPLTFPYGGHRVIPGWDLGFEGMRVGGKRRLFIPYQLAYGERGKPGSIPPKSELVFDMQLVSQSDQPPAPKTPATPPPPGTIPRAPGTPGQPGGLPATPPTGTSPGTPTSPSTPGSPATPPPAQPSSPMAPATPPPAQPAAPTTPHS